LIDAQISGIDFEEKEIHSFSRECKPSALDVVVIPKWKNLLV
jgi:hypothetical protein